MFAIMSLSLARRERSVHDVLARFCHIEEVSSIRYDDGPRRRNVTDAHT